MRVVFGRFEFDSDRRLLLETGRPVAVSPKAFLLLMTLIDQRPRVVSKSELHNILWPETHVVEANLTNLVAELRRALGEGGRSGVIRTAHGYGYAFDGEATTLAESRERPVQPLPGSQPTRSTACWLVIGEREVPLVEGEHLLGREPVCQIVVLDPSVSRRHARVRVVGDSATIEDLGSKNGTFVRGDRSDGAARLDDGDEIYLGTVRVIFRRVGLSDVTQTLPGATDLARRLREQRTSES